MLGDMDFVVEVRYTFWGNPVLRTEVNTSDVIGACAVASSPSILDPQRIQVSFTCCCLYLEGRGHPAYLL